ncbi:type II toxin-antitoxin system HipA family toxin [Caldimonas sp. KR1-144]|uniref:type II toxin-antitoxin system HipA family toxin n=1 Tax=Caldimonas sp. KR1-144 TaxID=3400911 RepID=UPI003C0E74A7
MSEPRLYVRTPTGLAGVLSHEALYLFAYSVQATPREAISLVMPVRLAAYDWPTLHPVFQMNLPEGYVLDQLRLRLAKTTGTDPLVLLAMMGAAEPIGRLRIGTQADISPATAGGERLADILAYRGAEGLFDSLVERYLSRTAVSGVQPKVLVPEAPARSRSAARDKAVGLTNDLIVKSGLNIYPGLAINEYLCMSAVAAAGIPTPEFFLSDDRSLFVMRRFDRLADGTALGFEDMAALAGLSAEQKYQGSYEGVAKLIRALCSPAKVAPSLAQLFDMVAMSCLLGNGDAHLKNFGLLYADPESDAVALAPAYDIVNTTCYLPDDALALRLGHDKTLFSSRIRLLEFAVKHCGIAKKRAQARVIELMDALHATLKAHRALADEVPGLRRALEKNLALFKGTFARP